MDAPHRRPLLDRRRLLSGALALAVALPVAACGGSDEPSASGLEQSEITVGMILIGDCAPLQIAVKQGLFKAEGLTVKTQVISGGQEAIPRLKGGQLDISVGNYVSFLAAQNSGTLKLKVVADGSQAAPKTHTVLVPKDSPIRTIADLRDKKIAVNTKRNVGTLMVRSAAKDAGVELDEDKNFVEVPPPNMEAALKSGSVDAVQAIEPFGTAIMKNLGARLLADMSSGATSEFPLSGYATTEEWAAKNPKTVAAFQRAMGKAAAIAADRKAVEQILPTYARGISPQVAAEMSLTKFPATLDPARLQRVADVMQQYGIVNTRIDVKPLIATGSGTTTG